MESSTLLENLFNTLGATPGKQMEYWLAQLRRKVKSAAR